MLESHSSITTSLRASNCLHCSRQAARVSSLRSVAPSVFFSRPPHTSDGTTHRARALTSGNASPRWHRGATSLIGIQYKSVSLLYNTDAREECFVH